MAAPESTSTSQLPLIALQLTGCFIRHPAVTRKRQPITPRTRAITLEGSAIPRTNRPMLPNISMATITFTFAFIL